MSIKHTATWCCEGCGHHEDNANALRLPPGWMQLTREHDPSGSTFNRYHLCLTCSVRLLEASPWLVRSLAEMAEQGNDRDLELLNEFAESQGFDSFDEYRLEVTT
jgi:hypothetical protein